MFFWWNSLEGLDLSTGSKPWITSPLDAPHLADLVCFLMDVLATNSQRTQFLRDVNAAKCELRHVALSIVGQAGGVQISV